MPFDALYTAGVFAAMAFATIGLGESIGRAVGLRDAVGVRWIWETALGFVAATLLLALLGTAGLLYRSAIVGATLCAALYGLLIVGRRIHAFVALRRVSPSAESAGVPRSNPPQWLVWLLTSAAIIAVTASFLGSLAPPTAGDALCYHLELPKRFLQEGRIDFRPDDDNITYPLVAEMGFLWALAFDAPAAAATVQWAFGLLLAGAAYLLALPYLGSAWSRLAAAVVLLAPGVNNQMTAPLNDLVLAACCALSLAAFDRARKEPSRGNFLLVGLLLGGALGVKYTAMIFAIALAAAWIRTVVDDAIQRRALLRGACLAATVAAAVGGLWYVRSAVYRGDPLYPFLSAHATTNGPSTFPETKTPLGRGPLAVVTAPWAMTMTPERFGGRSHQLGPLFLMFVPAAIAIGALRSFKGLATATLLYVLCCVMLRQNVRFLLPVVPVLAVFAVACWRQMMSWPRVPQVIACGAVAAVVLFQTIIPAARLRHTLAVVSGRQTSDEYLAEREPTYVAAAWINDHLPDDSRILSQEHRAFYVDPPVTRENIFRRRTHYELSQPGGAWAETLRREGFTHLLTAEGEGSHGPAYDATLSRLVDAALAADGKSAPQFVNQWRHRDDDGVERRYRLFALP